MERWGAPGRAGVLEDAVEGRIIELELRRLEEEAEEGPGTRDGGTSRAAGEGGAVVGLCWCWFCCGCRDGGRNDGGGGSCFEGKESDVGGL